MGADQTLEWRLLQKQVSDLRFLFYLNLIFDPQERNCACPAAFEEGDEPGKAGGRGIVPLGSLCFKFRLLRGLLDINALSVSTFASFFLPDANLIGCTIHNIVVALFITISLHYS